jgi:protein-L-isoaspartate(D-aspartate) O-methyltransferase
MMNADHQGIGMTSQRARNRLVDQLRGMGIQSEAVLQAILNTPRHLFIDEALASRAYDNTALPIGFNQTISQPYIVARMTEALVANNGDLRNVLEIGTGCGYQTVILAKFAIQVSSIERIDALLGKARERFYKLKCRNIRARNGDGFQGWPEHAPFDGILVSAAPAGVPKLLLDQLAINGRMVIPVGKSGAQELLLITRTDSGYAEQRLDSVSFVPMMEGID